MLFKLSISIKLFFLKLFIFILLPLVLGPLEMELHLIVAHKYLLNYNNGIFTYIYTMLFFLFLKLSIFFLGK